MFSMAICLSNIGIMTLIILIIKVICIFHDIQFSRKILQKPCSSNHDSLRKSRIFYFSQPGIFIQLQATSLICMNKLCLLKIDYAYIISSSLTLRLNQGNGNSNVVLLLLLNKYFNSQ